MLTKAKIITSGLTFFTIIFLGFGVASVTIGLNTDDNCGIDEVTGFDLSNYIYIHGVISLCYSTVTLAVVLSLVFCCAGIHGNKSSERFNEYYTTVILVSFSVFSLIWTVFTGIYIRILIYHALVPTTNRSFMDYSCVV